MRVGPCARSHGVARAPLSTRARHESAETQSEAATRRPLPIDAGANPSTGGARPQERVHDRDAHRRRAPRRHIGASM